MRKTITLFAVVLLQFLTLSHAIMFINLLSDRQIIQDQVLEILPMVSETSAISEELNKYQTFDVVLMTVSGQGTTSGNGTK